MRNVVFHKNQLKRIVESQGVSFTIRREGKNNLNEPDGSSQVVTTLKGIWHESQAYVNVTSGDSSTVRSKPQSQILTMFESSVGIEQGDYLEYNGQRYNVTGVHDPTGLKLAADISLEVVV